MSDVVDDRAHERFVFEREGDVAQLVYEVEGNNLLLVHTEVPDAFQGQGVGGRLVLAAVDRARAENLTVVPWCPFARSWLERHPDVTSTVTVDLDTPPGR
jgi:hypothetical protein